MGDETRRAEDTSSLSDARPAPPESQRIRPSESTSSETWLTLLLFEICRRLPSTPPRASSLLFQRSTTRATTQSPPPFTCESCEIEAERTRKSEPHHHDGALDQAARNKLSQQFTMFLNRFLSSNTSFSCLFYHLHFLT